MAKRKSQKQEPASYGTMGAHIGIGSMSRSGREGEHGSSFEETAEEIEEER